MGKLSLILSAALILTVNSCMSNKETSTTSDNAERNLEAMRGIIKCFNTKDFSKLGNFVAEDCIDHSNDKGDLKGLAEMRATFERWATMMDNTRTTTITEMANDEYVVSWVRFDITMKTDIKDKKVGEKLSKTDIEVIKCKNGKAIEHWTYIDSKEINKVLSLLPANNNAN